MFINRTIKAIEKLFTMSVGGPTTISFIIWGPKYGEAKGCIHTMAGQLANSADEKFRLNRRNRTHSHKLNAQLSTMAGWLAAPALFGVTHSGTFQKTGGSKYRPAACFTGEQQKLVGEQVVHYLQKVQRCAKCVCYIEQASDRATLLGLSAPTGVWRQIA
jgi:hypothetical protein